MLNICALAVPPPGLLFLTEEQQFSRKKIKEIKTQTLTVSSGENCSSKIYAAAVTELVCGASESVTRNEKRAEPAGDVSQVTLPSSDPHQLLCEGGVTREKVAWQMTET